MKKLIGILFLLLIIGFAGYFIYINYIDSNKGIPIKEVEEEKVSIEEYFVYGNHLNLKGSLEIKDRTYKDIKLCLYNGEDKDIEINTNYEDNKIIFNTGEYINEGLYIDNLDRGIYYLFLKLKYDNKEDEEKPIYKYYVLNNTTNYDETTYYTLSKYNNEIIINSNNNYQTLAFNINENKNSDIYDITLDPGHGGMDSGGVFKEYKESDFTMEISEIIKDNLEKSDIKVKLTHEKNTLNKNEVMDEYNKGGRAVIPNEIKSKYTFSIHINKNESSRVNGLEIYTPANINYDLAKNLANSIITNTDLGYSTNKLYKIQDGVYTHNFTESEIKSSLEGYEKKKYVPFNVTSKSNYLYMIRETGGYMTGAYVDESNSDKVGVNPYYNSNIGNESYLLELGYLSNQNDLEILKISKEKIATAISDIIISELNS